VGARSPHPTLFAHYSSDRKQGLLVAALLLTNFSIFDLDHPHVVVPYDVALISRHGFLLKSRFSASKRGLASPRQTRAPALPYHIHLEVIVSTGFDL
jgi:hypothetical protein